MPYEASEIIGGMPMRHAALYIIGEQLCEDEPFNDKLSNELASYKGHGGILKHDGAERAAFFKYCAKSLVAFTKKQVLINLARIGLFEDHLELLYTRVSLTEVEASSQFLLNHNHAPERIADSIAPTEDNQNADEIFKAEANVTCVMTEAIEAAKELNLPAFKSILEARKIIAEKRIERLRAKLG